MKKIFFITALIAFLLNSLSYAQDSEPDELPEMTTISGTDSTDLFWIVDNHTTDKFLRLIRVVWLVRDTAADLRQEIEDMATQLRSEMGGESAWTRNGNNVYLTSNDSYSVGIGTSSPAKKLDVQGAIIADTIYANAVGIGLYNNAGRLTFRDYYNTSGISLSNLTSARTAGNCMGLSGGAINWGGTANQNTYLTMGGYTLGLTNSTGSMTISPGGFDLTQNGYIDISTNFVAGEFVRVGSQYRYLRLDSIASLLANDHSIYLRNRSLDITAGANKRMNIRAGSGTSKVGIYGVDTLSLGGLTITGVAGASATGFLSSTDWNTFNNKITFPGFGTSGTTAAYGNHNHTGVYQPLLISGTNVKTINSQSILGSGNLTVYDPHISDTALYLENPNYEENPELYLDYGGSLNNPHLEIRTGRVTFKNTAGSDIFLMQGDSVTMPKINIAGNSNLNGVLFTGNTRTEGAFYTGTTSPANDQRLNYDGYLYATKFNCTDLTSSVLVTNNSGRSAGVWYTGTNAPVSNNRINYDGYLYATRFNGVVNASSETEAPITGTNGATSDNTRAAIRANAYNSFGYGLKIDNGSLSSNTSVGTRSMLCIDRDRTNVDGNISYDIISVLDNPSASGTISGKVLTATIGATERVSLNPRVADGSTAIAYLFDTHNSLTDNAAKILSLKNQGTEVFYVNKGGTTHTRTTYAENSAVPNYYSYVDYTNISTVCNSTERMNLNPNAANSGSPVAYLFDTHQNLTISGAKLLSLKNNGVEKFVIKNDTTKIINNLKVDGDLWVNADTISVTSTNINNGDSINITTDCDNLEKLTFILGSGTDFTTSGTDSTLIYCYYKGVKTKVYYINNDFITSNTNVQQKIFFDAAHDVDSDLWIEFHTNYATGTKGLTIIKED